MMEHAQVQGLWMMDVLGRGVVAERHDLDPLETHDAERLRPAPIVADAHADDRVECAPDFESLVADIEITLFEMLEWRLRQGRGLPPQLELAIAPDHPPVRLHQD